MASIVLPLVARTHAQAVWTNADDRDYSGNPPVLGGAFWSYGYEAPGPNFAGHVGNWSGNPVPGVSANGNISGPLDVYLSAPGNTLCDVQVTLNSLTFAAGGGLNLDFGSALTVASTTLATDGTMTLGGGGGAYPSYTNTGMLTKTAGTGTFTFTGGIVLDSTPGSTIAVASGSLQLPGQTGLFDTVTFSPAAGTLIDLVSTDSSGSQVNLFQGTLTNGAGSTGTVLLDQGTMAGTQRFLDASLIKPCTLAFAGSVFQWTGGNIGNYQQGAIFTNTGVVNISGDGTKETYANFTNQGIVIQSGTGAFNVGNYNSGGIFTNAAGATYDLRSDANVGQGGYPFNNVGFFKKSGGTGTSTLSVAFNNQGGTVEVDSGTLQLPLNVGSNQSTGGTLNVAAGAVLDLGDGQQFIGTYTGSGAGTVRLSKGTDPNNLYSDSKTGMTLAFPGSLFQWTGGTIGGYQGGHLVTNTGTITLSGDDAKTTLAKFTNTGTMIQSGAGDFNIGVNNSGGSFTNDVTGTYDLQSDAAIGQGDYPFVNKGSFQKSAGTGISKMTSALTNAGTISVHSGTLEFANDVNDVSNNTLTEGTWNVSNGATLALDGRTINTNQADVVLSGPNSTFPAFNSLKDNQGTFSLLALRQFTTAGDLSNEGLLSLDAGSTLHVNGNFTVGGASTSAASPNRRASSIHHTAATAAIAPATPTLQVVVGGAATQGTQSYGLLQVTGVAKLAGLLQVIFASQAAMPQAGDMLTVVSAQSVSGSFTNVANGSRLATSDGKGSFKVTMGAGSSANQVTLSEFLLTGQSVPVVPSVSFVVPGSDNGKSTTIAEGGPKLKLLVTRTGEDLSRDLTVAYKAGSSAIAGVDYKTLSGLVTIPAGSASVKLKIVALDDGVVDGTKVLKIKLIPSADGSYTLGDVPKAKVTILDAEGGQ